MLNARMMRFLASSALAFTTFYLLLSVLPLYVHEHGASTGRAGLVTGAMLLATVVGEPLVPALLRWGGYRSMMALGIVLLAVPSMVLLAVHGFGMVLAVSLARGLGFGIVVVTGTVLAANLGPVDRRGESLGLYGLAAAAPAIVALPAGVWISQHVGFSAVFLTTAAAGVVGLVPTAALPAERGSLSGPGPVSSVLRIAAVRRQAIVFAVTTLASGAIVTFLPIAVSGAARQFVALALLMQSVTTAATRWMAGRSSDRRDNARLLPVALVTSTVGIGLVSFTRQPVPVVIGAALFGAGFGAAQNLSLTSMLSCVARADYATVSAIWNIAFDAGLGVGAVGFGYIAVAIGFSAAFVSLAVALGLALALALVPRLTSRGLSD